MVSKDVIVTGGIRGISSEQIAMAQETMKKIVADNLPKTSAVIEFAEGYPPFAPIEGNYELMRLFSQISQDLGYGEVGPVNPADAGAADISFTAAFVERGIDGLGMSGADDHTIDETGDLRALPMQAKRSAVLLYRLMKQ